MKRLIGVVCLAVLLSSSPVLAVVYVKCDSPGPTFDGTSWDTAFHTIQEGINAAFAVGGDEVWVAAGSYVERISLNAGVGLYGGFAGIESSREQRDWVANATILDGDQGGTVVTILPGTELPTVVSGFVIRNGRATRGAGIKCSISSLTIAHNVITSNVATGQYSPGGGIACDGGSPTIYDNDIVKNYGGGIRCSYASPTISNNRIVANNGYPGISCHHSSPTIHDNFILANDSHWRSGGGIFCMSSSPKIVGNTIAGNRAENGGGLYCGKSSPTVVNNVIAFNSSGVFRYNQTGAPILTGNCVYGNPEYDYNGLDPGTGDFFEDPQFADLAYGDVHIQPTSPCVDRGSNDVIEPGWQDVDGQARIMPDDGLVDVGADESDGTVYAAAPRMVRVAEPVPSIVGRGGGSM